MKSFIEFLLEEHSPAPYGVIFDGLKKAYIGSHHTRPIILSDEIQTKVISLAKNYGIWYEGNGSDIKPNVKMFGKKDAYEGSWDTEFGKTIKGFPFEFIAGMFSNVKENKRVQAFTSPKISIFDSIIKNQEGNKYFEDRNYNKNDLSKLLIAASEKNVDFLEMSKMPATKENVSKFLTTGESLMWPENWEEYPNKLGKMTKKTEDMRNTFVLKQNQGVFVMGSGHLLELKALDKSLRMIGGEKA